MSGTTTDPERFGTCPEWHLDKLSADYYVNLVVNDSEPDYLVNLVVNDFDSVGSQVPASVNDKVHDAVDTSIQSTTKFTDRREERPKPPYLSAIPG